MPLLTRGLIIFGTAGVLFGVLGLVQPERCTGCHGLGFFVILTAWGVACVLSVLRGRAGLIFLLLAIAIPLVIIWAFFLVGLVFLGIIFFLARMSKDQLAPYYRWERAA
jgi:predicted membrane protein